MAQIPKTVDMNFHDNQQNSKIKKLLFLEPSALIIMKDINGHTRNKSIN